MTLKRDDSYTIRHLKGIDTLKYDKLKGKYGKDFEKSFNRLGGRIKRLGRMIDKRHKDIDTLQKEIDTFQKELKVREQTFKYVIQKVSPRIQIKKPSKSKPYWRCRVWYNIGKNLDTDKPNVKGRNIDVHICSPKYRKEHNLSDKEMREIGIRKFRKYILNKDITSKL